MWLSPELRTAICACLLCTAASPLLAQGPPAATSRSAQAEVARARAWHNDRRYDEAIVAARSAQESAEWADIATIVLARALLERYRERADPADLSAARVAIGSVRTDLLSERDRVELLLASGEALFLEDEFGAAAAVFESGRDRAAAVDPVLAESAIEWWGSAVERQVSGLAPEARRTHFGRLAERMHAELVKEPWSLAASYWGVVALRGAGETARAWDAAIAAWVRARLSGERAPALRADLDRLVLNGLIPDRVRDLAADQRATAASQFKADWELIKERWK